MRLIITDSGLGGLSVCAYLIKHLRTLPQSENYDIKYINAVPEDNYGYNLMASRDEKVITFNHFLTSVNKIYDPDAIFIACNSLSVIFSATTFAKQNNTTVHGIVETGVEMLLKAYTKQLHTGIIIMASDTTVEEQTYSRRLMDSKIPGDHIVSQACTNLANTISNDPDGKIVKEMIRLNVDEALNKFYSPMNHYLVYLGCTHYGYRRNIFNEILCKYDISFELIIPNEYVLPKLINMEKIKGENTNTGEISLEFITRYPIPVREINSLTGFLSPISPETACALQNYVLIKDLF